MGRVAAGCSRMTCIMANGKMLSAERRHFGESFRDMLQDQCVQATKLGWLKTCWNHLQAEIVALRSRGTDTQAIFTTRDVEVSTHTGRDGGREGVFLKKDLS